ncbi:hypothetical protein [Streptomyces sp. NPDC002573]|uniref:hypothetical protein n=1 Tax=Streptomyces sp. NPDC002573 TaxID=3364651 RepID=UPI0036CDC0BB
MPYHSGWASTITVPAGALVRIRDGIMAEAAPFGRAGVIFGPAAAEPETLHTQDWSSERWTAPPAVHCLTGDSLSGHLRPAGCTGRQLRRPPAV